MIEAPIVKRQIRARPRVERGLAFIPFQIPTLVDAAPIAHGWVHEIKLDGYRTELIIEDGEARAFTRNGYDWSDRYPHLVAAARALPVKRAILDGEAVVQNELGVTDFQAGSLLAGEQRKWWPARIWLDPDDDELALDHRLGLYPLTRAAAFVATVGPLRDDAFHTKLLGGCEDLIAVTLDR